MIPVKKKETEYDVQAREFAEKCGLTMTAVYRGHYKRLEEWVTANYEITLQRKGRRDYIFTLSTSINDSWRWNEGYPGSKSFKHGKGFPPNVKMECWKEIKDNNQSFGRWTMTQVKTTPTLYDILACLTKYDPGSFENFCSDFDYDEDSKKADKLFDNVKAEWRAVEGMFGDVLDELQEIN